MLLKEKEDNNYLTEFKNRIRFIEEIIGDKAFAKKLILTYNNSVYFSILDFILAKRPEIIKNMEKFKTEYERMSEKSNNIIL